MALSDRVTERYGTQGLVELTNPGDTSATTADTDRLGYACTDAAADLEIYAGVAYDETDARIVAVAVEGAVYHLRRKLRPGDPANAQLRKEWLEQLEGLGRVTGRNRISPRTNSLLDPTRERADGRVRPDFDRAQLEHMQLRPPGYAERED